MFRWVTRTALELIGQSGLGYSFDPLTENHDTANPYAQAIKKLSPGIVHLALYRQLFPFIVKITSAKVREFVMNLLPWKNLHELRDVTNILHAMSCEVLAARRLVLDNSDGSATEEEGKDIMSILCEEIRFQP